MIVRDEAHIVAETLAAVAAHIDYWVIVDTGSSDETIEVVRTRMDAAAIPGELHEREWRDFGSNRTEALELCRGKADYAWVIDADDLVVGDLDLTGLTADSYLLRYGTDFRYWRKQIFRDGLRWRFEGVVHEYARCLDPASEARLEGDYHIESRRLGARNLDRDKYRRDRELLEREAERDPDDPRTIFYLAQSHYDAGENRAALQRYTQRARMGGWEEEAFISRLRRGQCMERLDEPWGLALEAYLEAWQARPSRAEPLCEIARHHREAGEYRLGHLFARAASRIPYPEEDALFIAADVYEWRAADELAVCAFYIGRIEESFELASGLLEGTALPAAERARVEGNRDLCVPALAAERASYPAALVAELTSRLENGAPLGADVTATITSCRRPALFERTVNSFLNCCTDLDRIGRWICIDNGSTPSDRARMAELYPFFEFVHTEPDQGEGHAESINRILDLVATPWWLQLEDDWEFFWRGPYIGRAIAILEAEPEAAQVAFNVNYGETLEAGRRIVGGTPRRAAAGFPYRLHEHIDPEGEEWSRHFAALAPGSLTAAYWPHFTLRPSLIRHSAVAGVGRFDGSGGHFEYEFARRYADAGHRTAFFDQITCLHAGRRTDEAPGGERLSAYELVGDGVHPAHGDRAGPDPALPPALVINLDRRPDRWHGFLEVAAAAGGPEFAASCERVAAVDGSTLAMSNELRHTFRGNDFGFRRGIVGCALSHIGVWQRVATAAEAHLVFEDDTRLVERFPDRLAGALGSARPDFDLLILGQTSFDFDPDWAAGEQTSGDGVREMDWSRYVGATFAYVIAPAGARRLLGLVRRDGVQNGIDTFLMLKREELTVLECDPALAAAEVVDAGNDVDSDIQRDFEPVGRGPTGDGGGGGVAVPTLATLAPSCQIATLRLDGDVGGSWASAGIAATEDGFDVTVTTAADGSGGRRIVLDELLGVAAIEPIAPAPAAAGGGDPDRELLIDDRRLVLERDDGGSGHRFLSFDAAGDRVAATPPFSFTGTAAETCFGVAERHGELVIVFACDGQAGMIAAVELADVIDALRPWR